MRHLMPCIFNLLLIDQDCHFEQSEAYDISQSLREYAPGQDRNAPSMHVHPLLF